jgi:1,4-alpha-glucan branching enzyme
VSDRRILRRWPTVVAVLKVKGPGAKKKVAKVTFALATADGRVSVVGDFNDWDPLAHPLKKRSNGMRSVSIELPVGVTYRFKYLADDGSWFCDPDVDDRETNEYGEVNSVLHL